MVYSSLKKYLTEQQLLVYISILLVHKTRAKKNITPNTVYNSYLFLCQDCGIAPAFQSGIIETLPCFETAGLIRFNRAKITLMDTSESDILEIITSFRKDTSFTKNHNFESTALEYY